MARKETHRYTKTNKYLFSYLFSVFLYSFLFPHKNMKINVAPLNCIRFRFVFIPSPYHIAPPIYAEDRAAVLIDLLLALQNGKIYTPPRRRRLLRSLLPAGACGRVWFCLPSRPSAYASERVRWLVALAFHIVTDEEHATPLRRRKAKCDAFDFRFMIWCYKATPTAET
jgi:hypothetical protein